MRKQTAEGRGRQAEGTTMHKAQRNSHGQGVDSPHGQIMGTHDHDNHHTFLLLLQLSPKIL